MDMTVVVMMGAIAVDMGMCKLMALLIDVRVLVKVLMSMNMFVII